MTYYLVKSNNQDVFVQNSFLGLNRYFFQNIGTFPTISLNYNHEYIESKYMRF